MLGLFYLFFISQPDDQCVLSGSNKHIASLTCLSIVNLWRILSSGAILVSYSPKRLSINLLHLFFCLYSFSRVSFLYKLKKELLINYKLPKPYQFKKTKNNNKSHKLETTNDEDFTFLSTSACI